MNLSLPATASTAPAGPAEVDPERWPDVARLPRASSARTAVARRLVERALARLPLWTLTPDDPSGVPRPRGGTTGGPTLTLHDPDAFHRRIGADGLIGFGESYMAGEWDADDVVGVLTVLARHVDDLVPAPLRRLRGAWVRRRPAVDRNTLEGARENIHRHYDLSNELFTLFLDPGLTYSAAIFDPLPQAGTLVGDTELATAQHRKIDRLLDLAEVGQGTELLEIGTGWGELAIRASARGARVRTITLSEEQLDLARRRVADAGAADRVTVELLDYRAVQGRYDAVVSVEMIEAVGPEYWSDYFVALRRLLAPGGRVALQAITMPHERMLATARTHTWISKYVFPGGLIPSPEAIARESAAAGLRITHDTGYGDHYAETLRHWRERFLREESAVAALGFDHVFRRMWEFYLAYSEAGFRSGYLDVRQLGFVADDTEGTR
ncbi:cyclopropane-fatty-acyl-phospholipid synthase family protein [Streptomyces sp. HUAS YS2]|uniref:Cyclopropane-fatty-acyl-phospholipid synthase family protein n=1 Tax=Streptomyces solicathayae TaxID=3081768 RepID=A0ABZ0M426_9ACTN|nr:cyclopropane-fatty-acyl-phospholipid synthase family protein [Streptomyces sp. HUAS YS2]WOX26543.1 cyclopropane-fatty-acyl-phospholipid synthase family protein [Streptomyces sp. HUAS YS2]